MGRSQIVSRIGDFQIEWATDFPNFSVRQFLMEKKRFSERQYRYILSRAPILTWETASTQVNNERSIEKIKSHVKEAIRILGLSAKVADITLLMALKRLANSQGEMLPGELLGIISTIEKSQKTYIAAMGADTYRAATQYAKLEEAMAKNSKPPLPPAPQDDAPKLSYDEIIELIELRREFKAREASILERAEKRASCGETSSTVSGGDYTCVHLTAVNSN